MSGSGSAKLTNRLASLGSFRPSSKLFQQSFRQNRRMIEVIQDERYSPLSWFVLAPQLNEARANDGTRSPVCLG